MAIPETKPQLSEFNLAGLSATSDLNTIKGMSSTSFVVGGYQITGPMLVVGNQCFLWDVAQFGVGSEEALKVQTDGDAKLESETDTESVFYGWTIDAFRLFEFIDPTPEIIVIGTGVSSFKLPPFIRQYLYSIGMQVEVMSSRNAASTYNVLLQEKRRVACAILTKVPVSTRTGHVLVNLEETPNKST